jgi:tyrosinase
LPFKHLIPHVDAQNFYESSFWKDSDPVSGLGGWGDPNDDFAVADGGLSGMHVSYPSPHVIRRNFTLRPFDFPIPWFSDPSKIANTSITADVIESVVENYVGDFKAFQVAWEVRNIDKE